MKTITEKKYLKALKIVRAFHQQIENEISEFQKKLKKSNSEHKDKDLLIVGDSVECVEVHGNSEGNLTIGNKYIVKRTERTLRGELYFTIENDQGNPRKYNAKNNQFKALL